jgi:hypothetical protein
MRNLPGGILTVNTVLLEFLLNLFSIAFCLNMLAFLANGAIKNSQGTFLVSICLKSSVLFAIKKTLLFICLAV